MSKKNNRIYKIFLAMILLIIAIIIILMLIPGKTTNISEYEEKTESHYLSCTRRGGFDYTLLKNLIEDVNYDIKIKYTDDEIKELNIEINKDFQDKKSAEAFVNELHGNFNEYVGKNSLADSKLTPTYNSIDGIGKVTIFIDGQSFNRRTAPLVFLNDGAIEDVSLDSLYGFYKRSGFSCSKK